MHVVAMTSISGLYSATEEGNNEYNSHAHSDREEQHFRERHGRSSLRKNFLRQVSDKHLKRRMQMERTNNMNRRFLYHDHQTAELNEHDWHRRKDQGGFFFGRNKKKSVFIIISLLFLVLLVAIPFIWYLFMLSSSTIGLSSGMEKRVPTIMKGGETNNYQNDDIDGGGNIENNRSYQDLADSIRRLRIRRDSIKEESIGEMTGRQRVNKDKIHYGIEEMNNKNIGNDFSAVDDDIRMKRLEEKIRIDQNKIIRQEFSHNNDRGTERGASDVDNSEHRQPNLQDESLNHQHRAASSTKAVDKKSHVMSENLAALKLLNENLKKEAH